MLLLAEHHLKETAAVWYIGLEDIGASPLSVNELKRAMLHNFVLPEEEQRNRKIVSTLRLRGPMEDHISASSNPTFQSRRCTVCLSRMFVRTLPSSFAGCLNKHLRKGAVPDMQRVYRETLERAQSETIL